MHLTLFRRAVCALLSALAPLAAPLAAAPPEIQVPAIAETEQKALADYRLTLEKLDKLSALIKKIAAAARTDPQIAKEVDTLGGSDKLDSFEATNAIYEQNAPHLTAVLRGEGYDAREFVLSMSSVMLAYNAAKQKTSDEAGQILPFIPAANITLVEKNPARFEEVLGEIDSLNRLGPNAG